MQGYKRFILLFLFSISLFSVAQKSHSSYLTKKYSPEQLKQDLKILESVILRMHPVIGIYKPREYYVAMFDSLKQTITDSLPEKQFRIKLKLALDELHCGHTEVMYSMGYTRESAKMEFNYAPYYFMPVQNKVYMLASVNRKKDTLIKKGAEITAINGVSVDSMLNYCRRFISTDGYNKTGKDRFLKIGFNSYYPALFGRPDTFNVEFKSNSHLEQVKFPAIKVKSLPAFTFGNKDDSLYVKFKSAQVKYRFIDSSKKTMVVKISAFSRKKFKIAYSKVFAQLKENNSENLVIDLRNNGGGSIANAYKLLSYLIDEPMPQTLRTSVKSYPEKKYTHGNGIFKMMRFTFRLIAKKKTENGYDNYTYTIKPGKKDHFKGKVIVLVNGGSFSASCLVAAYLKHKDRAVFVGEETAGAIEGCNAGITPYYRLPNTGVRVRIPAFRIVHDVSSNITGRGIIPDYKTSYTIKDVFEKKDVDLEKVKELLKIR